MELTTWQKICHRVLGRALKKRARSNAVLSKQLEQAAITTMPEVYLAVNIVSTIAVTIISIAFVVLFFLPEIGVIAFWESLQNPATLEPCRVWEYWNKDIVAQNANVAGKGCPDYATRVFPPMLKILIPLLGGLVIPWMSFKYFNGTTSQIVANATKSKYFLKSILDAYPVCLNFLSNATNVKKQTPAAAK